MINKNQFVEFISNFRKFESEIDSISEFMHIDDCYLWEQGFASYVGYMYDIFIASILTEEGADLVNSYVFENNIYPDNIDSLESLYDYLVKNEYFI